MEMSSKFKSGEEVEYISWIVGGETESATFEDGCAFLQEEYMGDHSEFFVIELDNGKEVCRYNVRFIDTIVWRKPS